MPETHEPDDSRYDRLTSGDWYFLVSVLVILPLISWDLWDSWQERDVVRSEPIGTVQRIAASTGKWTTWSELILETEAAFYPVRREFSVRKGTPLVLETRRNGKRFICDPQTKVCVRTL